jgi:NTP pyrophosphatase (non-canonical NTP hydrolase)
MMEMMKQVGELAKYVMSAEHYYVAQRDQMPEYRADLDTIGDELADVLFMLIRVADYYGIDLLEAHVQARRGEDEWLQAQGV